LLFVIAPVYLLAYGNVKNILLTEEIN